MFLKNFEVLFKLMCLPVIRYSKEKQHNFSKLKLLFCCSCCYARILVVTNSADFNYIYLLPLLAQNLSILENVLSKTLSKCVFFTIFTFTGNASECVAQSKIFVL